MDHPDRIARAVQEQYAILGKTGKPQVGEWTVLAGFVLLRGPRAPLEVVALGTGTKCLSRSQVAQDGAGWVVHDAHAEVCARRSLLLFLLDQVELAAARPHESILVAAAGGDGFELRPGMSLHMYSSQPPCGDAALFEAADAEPSEPSEPSAGPKRQRLEAYFEEGSTALMHASAHSRRDSRRWPTCFCRNGHDPLPPAWSHSPGSPPSVGAQ